MEYLGYEITPGRLSDLETHTGAVRGATFKTTGTQVRSFIGMCHNFLRFSPNIARLARPLTELTAATAPLLVPPPTAAQEQTFQELKRHLVAPPRFALPRARGTYVLDVDFEGHVGGTLLLEQEVGSLQFVVYLSRTLDNRERAFGVTENECLAVLWASLLLRAYMEANRLRVRTLHDCLRWILNVPYVPPCRRSGRRSPRPPSPTGGWGALSIGPVGGGVGRRRRGTRALSPPPH